MPGAVIAIEAPDARKSAELEQALLEACEVGLIATDCVANAVDGPTTATAIATVAWRGRDRLDAVIEVGRHANARPEWLARELHFRPEDDALERWKAVGFTIATLASEVAPREIRERAPDSPNDPPQIEPAPPPIDDPKPAPSVATLTPPRPRDSLENSAARSRPSRSGFSFVVGATAGPGFEVGPWRVGGFIGLAQHLGALPIRVQASGSYARREQDDRGINAEWLAASLGPALHLALPVDAAVLASLELVAENVNATAETSSGTQDSSERLVVGGKVAAGISWPNSAPVAGVLFGEASRLSGGTTIRYRGERLASSPAANYALRLGIEWRPF